MGVLNPNNVKVGVGSLYAAPIGTAEPTGVTGAWTGWTPLGYTETGSEFDITIATAPLMVEEEFWPLRTVTTGYSGKLIFILAEVTRQNLALVLNAGIGSGVIAASQGMNADGSIWQETPAAGSEVRVMLGWDALPLDTTAGADPEARLIVRQALQTGTVKRMARKGNNKSSWAASFDFEKPIGVQPFRWIFEPNLAA